MVKDSMETANEQLSYYVVYCSNAITIVYCPLWTDYNK